MKKVLLLSLLLIATMFLFAEPEVEPNNAWNDDGVITVENGVNEGTIDPGADLDYWAFQASVGDEVIVSTVGLTEIDTKLWLYDIDGVTELAYNDDTGGLQSEVSITVALAGTYYFAVGTYSDNMGEYGVSLAGATTPTYLDNDLRAMGIAGNPTPTVNVEQICNVAVMNVGNNDATDFAVELFNGDNVSIGITDGVSLVAGENMVVDVNWTPDTEGVGVIYAVINFAADEDTSNNQTDDLNVDVQSEGMIVITLGDGTDDGHYLPCNYFYKNSLAEQLYYAEELQVGGALMAIDFFYTFADIPTTSDLNIWIGETELTDLSAGFIPSTELTQIHSGPLAYSVGVGTIHIPLATPYAYGGGNLVVLVERPMDTVYYSSSDNFYYTNDAANPARSVYKYSDSVDYDPAEAYTDGTNLGAFPNTAFYFITQGMGAITGTVTSEGTPVAGVTVSVDGTAASTVTNADGVYTFSYIAEGTVDLTASLFGYSDGTVTGVVVVEDETTTADITILPLPTVSVSGDVFGSDYPTVGIADAEVSISGYENYEGMTDANGNFVISGIYTDHEYEVSISAVGYQSFSGTVTVATSDVVMDDVVLLEVVSPASNVVATPNAAYSEVAVTWEEPTGAVNAFEFDGTTFPDGFVFLDDTWSMEGDGYLTSTGNVASAFHSAYNDVVFEDGVFEFVWQRTAGSESNSQGCVVRGTGDMGTGSGYIFVFSGNGSYICGTLTNGAFDPWVASWTPSANLITGLGMDNTINISMQGSEISMYINGVLELTNNIDTYPSGYNVIGYYEAGAGDIVKFDRYEFIDGGTIDRANEVATTEVSSSSNNVDFRNASGLDRKIVGATARSANAGSKVNVVVNSSTDDRMVETYNVHRLLAENQGTPEIWTELATGLTDLSYTDAGFEEVEPGVYKYAVTAIFTNDVPAPAAFSNEVPSGVMGTVTFDVTTNDAVSAEGANIVFTANDGDPLHVYEAVVGVDGSAIINDVWFEIYTLEISLAGHDDYVENNIAFEEDSTVEAELAETLNPVAGLEADDNEGDNSVTISWADPGAQGDTVEEGFEGGSLPEGWSLIDNDGDGFDWVNVVEDGFGFEAHTGEGAMTSASYVNDLGALTPDNYLISPQLVFGATSQLSFWVAAQDPNWAGEHYYVKISTSGSDVADFDDVVFEETLADGEWHEVVVDLSAYAGQQGYIAWNHCEVTDMFYMKMDDVSVFNATRATRELLSYTVKRDGEVIASDLTEVEYTDTDLENDEYTYSVAAVYTTGTSPYVDVVGVVNVAGNDNIIPLVTALNGNYPNPFNPVTTISYDLATAGDVNISVYNAKGQLVKTLVNEYQEAAQRSVVWSGLDNSNRSVASGVYFYKMNTTGFTSINKMILMK